MAEYPYKPPTPDAIPPEAIDAAADAMDNVNDINIPWESYAAAALEAAAPAIRAQAKQAGDTLADAVKAQIKPNTVVAHEARLLEAEAAYRET